MRTSRRCGPILCCRNCSTLSVCVAEDSVRRAFAKQDEDKLTLWIDTQMGKTFEALLARSGCWTTPVQISIQPPA